VKPDLPEGQAVQEQQVELAVLEQPEEQVDLVQPAVQEPPEELEQ